MSTHIMITRSRVYKEFRLFYRLPPELRLVIWECATDLLGFTWYELKTERSLQKMITPLWSVNHESREAAIRHSGVKPLGLYQIKRPAEWFYSSGPNTEDDHTISQCFEFNGHVFFTMPQLCQGDICGWRRNRYKASRDWDAAACITFHDKDSTHEDCVRALARSSPIHEAFLQRTTPVRGLFILSLDKFNNLTSPNHHLEPAVHLQADGLTWSRIFKAEPDVITRFAGCRCTSLTFMCVGQIRETWHGFDL